MGLIVQPTPTTLYTSNPTGNLDEPVGAQDGNLQFIIQNTNVSGFTKPAGWLDVPIPSVYVGLTLWWGIRGIHFAGGTEALTGNVNAANLMRYEVTGDVDENCVILAAEESWPDGEFAGSGYAYSPAIDLSAYPNRPRILGTFGGQIDVPGPFASFQGNSGMSDTPVVNRLQAGSAQDDNVSFLFNFYEDKAAAQAQNGRHRYYVYQPHDNSHRSAMANFVIIAPEKQQTDILTPPPLF